MNAREVYELAREVGLDHEQAITATAIAWGESELNPNAVGDTRLVDETWGPSIGLWQIRSLRADKGTGGARDADRLKDPAFNARAMYLLSDKGTRWKPWSIFNSGAYIKYLDQVRAAVEEVVMAVVNGGPVRSHVQTFANRCQAEVGQTSYGTYNGHQPTRDRALDMFASKAFGDKVADWVLANWDKFGLMYLIWQQHIYNPSVSKSWRLMENRGSITDNHYDHLHASFVAAVVGIIEESEDDLMAVTDEVIWTKQTLEDVKELFGKFARFAPDVEGDAWAKGRVGFERLMFAINERTEATMPKLDRHDRVLNQLVAQLTSQQAILEEIRETVKGK